MDLSLDTREVFFDKIKKYYQNKGCDDFSEEILQRICSYLTDLLFTQYYEFRKKYPKSKKRYSILNLEDLENPFIHDRIINFVKESYGENYISLCSSLFGMSENEFVKYEERRVDFRDMF